MWIVTGSAVVHVYSQNPRLVQRHLLGHPFLMAVQTQIGQRPIGKVGVEREVPTPVTRLAIAEVDRAVVPAFLLSFLAVALIAELPVDLDGGAPGGGGTPAKKNGSTLWRRCAVQARNTTTRAASATLTTPVRQ